MNKDFIPYEQALALEELGFDEPCFAVYIDKTLIMEDDWLYSTNQDTFIESSNFTAPLYQQAFRWFREKHNLEGEVHCIRFNSKRLKGYQYAITSRNYQKFEQLGDYHTYEEAEFACITELIEIVKKK
jgi:hypothetical protein